MAEGTVNVSALNSNSQEKIDAIYNNTVLKINEPELLWTNPNMTADFSDQTLTLDSSAYRYLIVKVSFSKSDAQYPDTVYAFFDKKSTDSYKQRVATHGSRYRTIEVSDSEIIFSEMSGTSQAIPNYIWGLGKYGE